MMESNVAEALGSWGARSLQARLKQWGEQEDEQPTALDGRMLVQEWIRTPDGHIKVDVVDHSDDHFFPGHQDIAWDVAGTCLEFNLDRDQRHELISKYRSASLDSQINRRLHFFASAYLAYRLGYAMMAEASLNGTADGLRFRSEVRRYREGLMLELASSEGSRWDV
jgi:hypothetical protein